MLASDSRDALNELRQTLRERHREALTELREVVEAEKDELRESLRDSKRRKVKLERENVPPPSGPRPPSPNYLRPAPTTAADAANADVHGCHGTHAPSSPIPIATAIHAEGPVWRAVGPAIRVLMFGDCAMQAKRFLVSLVPSCTHATQFPVFSKHV